jgi:sigma-54 dependent transcriptional regulator, acetoin dehydrogenase operon transcriptional activator AcoR
MTIVKAAFRAHEQYVSIGKLSPALLREPVFRAWERSHLQGASALRAKAIQLEPLETERLLESKKEIILAAQPYLRALSKAAGSVPHAAMLGDAQAIVLDVKGDEQTVHGPVSVPGPGSLLDEGACGANGIGTPLAEGAYAELVGPEHFIGGFHPFTGLMGVSPAH